MRYGVEFVEHSTPTGACYHQSCSSCDRLAQDLYTDGINTWNKGGVQCFAPKNAYSAHLKHDCGSFIWFLVLADLLNLIFFFFNRMVNLDSCVCSSDKNCFKSIRWRRIFQASQHGRAKSSGAVLVALCVTAAGGGEKLKCT